MKDRPFLLPVETRRNSRKVMRKEVNLATYEHLQGLFFIDFFGSYVNMIPILKRFLD